MARDHTRNYTSLTDTTRQHYPNQGKIIAVSDDIDPNNADAVFWSIAYRSAIMSNVVTVPYRSGGHGPKSGRRAEEGTLLIDATLKADMPPLALPAVPCMTHAREIWEELDLPRLSPQPPWHGYHLGDWDPRWSEFAVLAARSDWQRSGEETHARRAAGMTPETPVHDIED